MLTVSDEFIDCAATFPFVSNVAIVLSDDEPTYPKSLFVCRSFKFSEKMDVSKYLLRKFGDKKLPIEISQKKKLGFPVPLDKWLKGNFLNYSKEILLDDRTTKRGLFKKEQIEKLLNNPQILEYDFWGKKIWMLINVELWSRNFID